MNNILLFLLAATVALPAADSAETKPGKVAKAGRAALVPDLDGISKEDMAKFRAAFAKAQLDEAVKAAREKVNEKRKSMEFATAAEKKDARADFETLSEEVRKALRAAIAKADGSLSKEVIEKATDALEDKLKEKAKEAAASKKGAETKGAAKPGEKKPEAPAIGK